MNTWTLTSSSQRGQRTIIGTSRTAEHARQQVVSAAETTIRSASANERPRYTLHVGEQLIAIIQTGDDELGLPDHPGTADLLAHMQHSRNPFNT